ncbi:hypothetical protein CONCODRAFT_14142 [Conidiobolus coronatus NRRL 28638]|uniref:Uncharacterized protein n=1 Tax=Conidiobolus coronatus (strain ATCC 28846 / CBS 209.66 / NRRL 28638) TaxID=796925 RepID=A0A137NPJ8_CONC2|nr:hypothetical protein CONCODRAFT_14142 [Conidiobolus coronatus NRRL 28638]|eukprot:KXN64665.1 hypothetical protein CONCODRAFT_14142 [Conidiobolus coronatus NRRL 28638]
MGNNSAILLADYKENFQIGGLLIENSQIHYFKVPIALLSFGMYFKVDNIVKFKLFNFFSYILDKDSQSIQHCLTLLLFNPFIIKSINTIEMWTDCAGHFRSKYMLNYYKSWNEFSLGVKFTYVNFFNEKHGKSILDGYFGVLSRWQSDYEKSGKINNINHLVDIFSEKHNQSNPKLLYYNYENTIIYYQSISRHLYYKNIDDIKTFLSYKLDDNNPNIILRSPYRNFNLNSYTSIYSETHYKINPKSEKNNKNQKLLHIYSTIQSLKLELIQIR